MNRTYDNVKNHRGAPEAKYGSYYPAKAQFLGPEDED